MKAKLGGGQAKSKSVAPSNEKPTQGQSGPPGSSSNEVERYKPAMERPGILSLATLAGDQEIPLSKSRMAMLKAYKGTL